MWDSALNDAWELSLAMPPTTRGLTAAVNGSMVECQAADGKHLFRTRSSLVGSSKFQKEQIAHCSCCNNSYNRSTSTDNMNGRCELSMATCSTCACVCVCVCVWYNCTTLLIKADKHMVRIGVSSPARVVDSTLYVPYISKVIQRCDGNVVYRLIK